MTNAANLKTRYTLQLCKNKQETNEEKFKAAIIEAVDESLSSFNNLDKQSIYLHLANAFKIKKEEIPCKIKDFADAIEQMFGVGAKLIEIRIIKALHTRIPDFMFFPTKSHVDFKEYVVSLHAFLLHAL
jgi:hypothetical protein